MSNDEILTGLKDNASDSVNLPSKAEKKRCRKNPQQSKNGDSDKNEAVQKNKDSAESNTSSAGSIDDARKKSMQGHRQRIRRRFDETGFNGFAPHEVLEYLLFSTIPRKDTKQIAHELINQFGSVSACCHASYDELIKIPGLGSVSAHFLISLPHLLKYIANETYDSVTFDNAEKLSDFCRKCFTNTAEESIIVICLDSSFRLIDTKTIGEGDPVSAVLDTRTLIMTVINTHCVYAVLSHNHPNGSSKPSEADIAMTKTLHKVLANLDVILYDHVIIGCNDYCSLKEQGYFGRTTRKC